jgi:hypothetical protein
MVEIDPKLLEVAQKRGSIESEYTLIEGKGPKSWSNFQLIDKNGKVAGSYHEQKEGTQTAAYFAHKFSSNHYFYDRSKTAEDQGYYSWGMLYIKNHTGEVRGESFSESQIAPLLRRLPDKHDLNSSIPSIADICKHKNYMHKPSWFKQYLYKPCVLAHLQSQVHTVLIISTTTGMYKAAIFYENGIEIANEIDVATAVALIENFEHTKKSLAQEHLAKIVAMRI